MTPRWGHRCRGALARSNNTPKGSMDGACLECPRLKWCGANYSTLSNGRCTVAWVAFEYRELESGENCYLLKSCLRDTCSSSRPIHRRKLLL